MIRDEARDLLLEAIEAQISVIENANDRRILVEAEVKSLNARIARVERLKAAIWLTLGEDGVDVNAELAKRKAAR